MADTWGQVWDILPVAWEKVHYVLGRRRCSCCGTVNTAVPPFGQAGAVVYGPNLNAAAILLSSQGNVVAFGMAILAIKAFVGFLAKHGFAAFGWYRIILGGILLLLIANGVDLAVL